MQCTMEIAVPYIKDATQGLLRELLTHHTLISLRPCHTLTVVGYFDQIRQSLDICELELGRRWGLLRNIQ